MARPTGVPAVTQIDDRPSWQHDPWDLPDVTDALVIERPRKQRRWIKWIVYSFLLLGMIAVVAVGVAGLWYTDQVNPPGAPGDAVTFTVNPGDTLQSVSLRLQAVGLVEKASVFRWYVEHHGGLVFTPGYYRLRPRDHMGNIMRTLSIPPSQTYTKVTFPEGFTFAKMGARLQLRVPRLSAAAFEKVATSGRVRSKYEPANVKSLEGLLFPDTYQVSNGETEAQVARRMVTLMERVGRQENIDAAPKSIGFTPYQVLIIASMIEREAKVDADRSKIARVIYNRLYLGMPLQIDATLLYNQPSTKTFAQLKATDTPYNTYMHKGLPPTPIANPGRASIHAALNAAANPSKGDPLCVGLPSGVPCVYLYYVLADSDGRHVFAVTAQQHEANVAKARAKGLLGP
jgi:UPF0755 protein